MEAAAGSARDRYLALVAAFLGWMFDGLEQGMFPLAGRPALHELLAAEAAAGVDLEQLVGIWFGRIIALFLIGAAVGGVVFGWLGDRIGRVRAMAASVLVYSLFTGLCALAGSAAELAGLRFVASVGMGGEWALGVALVMEVWPARLRPLMAAFIGMSANVGFLLVGLAGLGLAGIIGGLGEVLHAMLPASWAATLLRSGAWRVLFLLGALPAVLTFFIRIFVPESERWREATRHGPKPRVGEIFAPTVIRQTMLGLALAALVLMGTWGSVQWIPAWIGRTGGDPSAAARSAICIAIGATVGSFSVALLAQRFNRRVTYLGLCLGSFVVCQILFRTVPGGDAAFAALVVLTGALTAGFFGWLPLYLPELFSTRIRATATGFAYNGGRIVAAAGTLGSGALVSAFDGDYARMGATMTFVYLLGPILVRFAPETKNRPLPS